MQAGDLIKHRRNDSTALVISVVADKDVRDPEYDQEWATVLFTGDSRAATVPYELLKKNWKVINEKL